jgi:four helix bundle protein
MMELARKNVNRGYQKLVVWQDSIAFFVLTQKTLESFPYILLKVASQQIASVDSIHRNIAEGFCRRGIKEYLFHLNVALGSLGESVSGQISLLKSNTITETKFDELDSIAFKIENGLLALIKSLQQKQKDGDWLESFA